ncbi:MAG: hypothetical protein AAB585_00850 [Patescibacteria group bacterium]
METEMNSKTNVIHLPISLEQLATGLRKLSRSDLTTLELMLDRPAMRTIQKGLRDTNRGKIKKLRA